MSIQSCLTKDLPQRFGEDNYAPIIEIESVSLDPSHSIYDFEDIIDNPKITLDVVDYNSEDKLAGAWFIKDINNPEDVESKLIITKTLENNIASFEYTIEKDNLTCGINQLTFIVSDRGFRNSGIAGEDGKPYPSSYADDSENVKVDIMVWSIRKRCE